MEVRFLDHRVDPGLGQPRLDWWREATQAPGKDDFVNLGSPHNRKTWIVRYLVWRPGGTTVDVYCAPWEFNL